MSLSAQGAKIICYWFTSNAQAAGLNHSVPISYCSPFAKLF